MYFIYITYLLTFGLCSAVYSDSISNQFMYMLAIDGDSEKPIGNPLTWAYSFLSWK